MDKKAISIVVLFLIGIIFSQSAYAISEYMYLIEISRTSFLPSTIYAGNIVSVAVDIKNRGSYYPILDLNVSLDVGNQFESLILDGNVGLITPGSTKTFIFKFRVKDDTPPSYYPALLTMTYLRDNQSVKETQSIDIPVSRTEKKIDVTLSPKIVAPGKQTEFIFTLKNVGGAAVSNISFSWDEKNDLVLPLGSDNKRYVSVLDTNQQAEVSYTVAVDPNITPGVYPLDVNVTFADFNGTRTQPSQIGIIIGGITDFEVSAEMLSTGQLSVSIANIGLNNAGAVVVKIPRQSGVAVTGSNTAILGNLNKGEFTLASFQMQQTASDQNISSDLRERFRNMQISQDQNRGGTPFMGAGTAKDLLVEIDYTDTTGERQTVQKPIQLSASGLGNTYAGRVGQSNDAVTLLPWVLLALLVGGAVAFNKFRAKKGWKMLTKIIAAIAILFLATIFLLGSDYLAVAASTIVSLVLLAWFFRKKFVPSFAAKAELFRKK